MKAFHCKCGRRVFFENTRCVNCQRRLGFDPIRGVMVPLEPIEKRTYRDAEDARREYRLCRNDHVHNVCNWLLPAQHAAQYCLACSLNHEVPILGEPRYHSWWRDMEAAKRRLLYVVLMLRLPIVSKLERPDAGLAFAFVADKRSNPNAVHDWVSTGHSKGLITVNMMEADPAARESTRVEMHEAYRTLLGHFRHESGHYYWPMLVQETGLLETFRALFGDERLNYTEALKRHYEGGLQAQTEPQYISSYSRAHPWEDWAETWAHYLHIADAMETACAFELTGLSLQEDDFQQCLAEWSRLTVMLNEMNRSVGQHDAYPFVLSENITGKFEFVHQSLAAYHQRAQAGHPDHARV